MPTTALPTLQGVLKDGFRDTVVAQDMPKPCEFSKSGTKSMAHFKVLDFNFFNPFYILNKTCFCSEGASSFNIPSQVADHHPGLYKEL